MLSGFWSSLSPQSGVLAAWISSVAGVILIIGLLLTWGAMRLAARTTTLPLMQERFNAPAMLRARAVFTWCVLNPKDEVAYNRGYIPKFGWIVIDFLNQVGYLVDSGQLRFEDAEIAYSSHALGVWGNQNWRKQLENDWVATPFAPFRRMCERMKKSEPPRTVNNEYQAAFTTSFWECEASLLEEEEVKALLHSSHCKGSAVSA